MTQSPPLKHGGIILRSRVLQRRPLSSLEGIGKKGEAVGLFFMLLRVF